jgi:hypothetical protein
VGLYKAPCLLFREFLQLRAEKHPFSDEIRLLNAFFTYFASLGEKKIPYRLYGSCLSENRELILNNKQHFDGKSILTVLSFSDDDRLSPEELELFRAFIDRQTLLNLPQCFWKSAHILSLLPIIQQTDEQIPFAGLLQLKMRKDIPQAEVDKYALNTSNWQKLTKAIVVSQEKKQCNLFQILRVLTYAANHPENNGDMRRTACLQLQMMLKYCAHLKVKEKWEVCDIAKFQDVHLLEAARHLKPADYKYLLPFCVNPEALFAALQQNPAYHFRSIPLICFANRMPKHTISMRPIEEVITGLRLDDADTHPHGDFEYYFDDPKTLREIGIYESRCPGQKLSLEYNCLSQYALEILETYPMKDSDFEKASVGIELLKRRQAKSRRL